MNDGYLGDRGKVVIQQPRVSASVIILYLQSEISFKSAILTKFFTGLQDSWLARLSYHLGDCKHWPACDMWLVNKRSRALNPERWLVEHPTQKSSNVITWSRSLLLIGWRGEEIRHPSIFETSESWTWNSLMFFDHPFDALLTLKWIHLYCQTR